MKSVVLFEDEGYANLLPLLFWRSVFELRVGRKIMLDHIAQRLGAPIAGVWTRDWISSVAAQRCGAPANQPAGDGTVLINGRWLFDKAPTFETAPCAGMVDGHVAYIVCDAELAANLAPADLCDTTRRELTLAKIPRVEVEGSLIRYPWDIISNLGDLLAGEWKPNNASIESEIDERVCLEPADQIHIGPRSTIHPTAVVDASAGSVFIDHDAQIGAYAIVEGPIYVGPGTQISPHAWLHGGNAIGPVCKLGGEIHGCVIDGYTNKQHAGFLGHSYVGSWVNIGAGCVNSDLKNTYGHVRVPVNRRDVDTGLQFFGAIIADHVKIGINATIPTGGVIGMSATIATTHVIPKFVPSFAWLTDDGLKRGDPGRLLDASVQMMVRRGIDMTDEEVEYYLDLGTRVRSYESNRSVV
ncbi:MAG: putative sugar nucleotidyl transferase [Planctomycetota bacterium]|jgi:UDP-N-acetylglucosamine diphosphorylase/glucosamine-1-phosphate N-acetyltransferase